MESTPPAGESWEHTANFLCVFGAGALRVLCNLFDADEQVSYHAACHTLLALAAERPAALRGGDVLRWAMAGDLGLPEHLVEPFIKQLLVHRALVIVRYKIEQGEPADEGGIPNEAPDEGQGDPRAAITDFLGKNKRRAGDQAEPSRGRSPPSAAAAHGVLSALGAAEATMFSGTGGGAQPAASLAQPGPDLRHAAPAHSYSQPAPAAAQVYVQPGSVPSHAVTPQAGLQAAPPHQPGYSVPPPSYPPQYQGGALVRPVQGLVRPLAMQARRGISPSCAPGPLYSGAMSPYAAPAAPVSYGQASYGAPAAHPPAAPSRPTPSWDQQQRQPVGTEEDAAVAALRAVPDMVRGALGEALKEKGGVKDKADDLKTAVASEKSEMGFSISPFAEGFFSFYRSPSTVWQVLEQPVTIKSVITALLDGSLDSWLRAVQREHFIEAHAYFWHQWASGHHVDMRLTRRVTGIDAERLRPLAGRDSDNRLKPPTEAELTKLYKSKEWALEVGSTDQVSAKLAVERQQLLDRFMSLLVGERHLELMKRDAERVSDAIDSHGLDPSQSMTLSIFVQCSNQLAAYTRKLFDRHGASVIRSSGTADFQRAAAAAVRAVTNTPDGMRVLAFAQLDHLYSGDALQAIAIDPLHHELDLSLQDATVQLARENRRKRMAASA
jgi:hypothetical protein